MVLDENQGVSMNVTELDFERLFTAQMEFAANKGWKAEQEFRFDENINWDYKFIYWFDTYSDALIASQFLKITDFGFNISFDEGTENWVIVTDYAADWVK